MYNPAKPYKKEILKLIQSTWQTPYVKVKPGLYPIFQKSFSRPEIQHTDGLGTKGIYHWQKGTLKNAVLDALAMNLNDLAMSGARPYALQNHLIIPEDNHEAILKIIRELARECSLRKIAMTGGETSIHNGEQGMDLSITVSGFLERLRRNECQPGDLLIGLKSNGLHSNGFTKVREIFGKQYKSEFTRPTRIYLDLILPWLAKYQINGLMHITGGAFAKLKDILPSADAKISYPPKLQPQKIFREIFSWGVSSREMYSTFNCGVGFVLSVPPKAAKLILAESNQAGIVGEVIHGTGKVWLKSAFDEKMIKL